MNWLQLFHEFLLQISPSHRRQLELERNTVERHDFANDVNAMGVELYEMENELRRLRTERQRKQNEQ